MNTSYSKARKRMVGEQLIARDIVDARVLAAMSAVPRELFVPENDRVIAYSDHPLPIGADQTISQPYIVALMAQALKLTGTEYLLEAGGGCGYSAAVYGQLAAKVDSYEIIPELAEHARINIAKVGSDNVHVFAGDATSIDGEEIYDAISVAAAPAKVPTDLVKLLKKGGRMVIPVGPQYQSQWLTLITKQEGGGLSEEALCAVGFVPLTAHPSQPLQP